MKLSCTEVVRKRIALVFILLLAAVCCSSFNISSDTFGTGGSISGCKNAAITHSQILCTPQTVGKDCGSEVEQSMAKTAAASDLMSRAARKLLQFREVLLLSGSGVSCRIFTRSICILAFAYRILLTHIRFIHLKDGSK